MAEENYGKPQLGNNLMNAVQSVIASNRVPYLQMTSVGSHRTSKKEERKVLICYGATGCGDKSIILNLLSMEIWAAYKESFMPVR